MANPVVDVETNLANFPSGSECAITAALLRLFVQSAMGYQSVFKPNNTNDAFDTAGIGSTFNTGNIWYDTSEQTVWFCITGKPAGFAVWISFPAVTGAFPIGVFPSMSGGILKYEVSLDCPLDIGCIPPLPASQITSGVFDISQIPDIPVSKLIDCPLDISCIPPIPPTLIEAGFLPSTVLISLPSLPSGYPASELGPGLIPPGVTIPVSQVIGGGGGLSWHHLTFTGTATNVPVTLWDTGQLTSPVLFTIGFISQQVGLSVNIVMTIYDYYGNIAYGPFATTANWVSPSYFIAESHVSSYAYRVVLEIEDVSGNVNYLLDLDYLG